MKDMGVSTCGDLAEQYGVTDDGQIMDALSLDQWRILGCKEKVCGAWKEAYGVVPGNGWGDMPDQFKAAWDALDCNNKWQAYEGWRGRVAGGRKLRKFV